MNEINKYQLNKRPLLILTRLFRLSRKIRFRVGQIKRCNVEMGCDIRTINNFFFMAVKANNSLFICIQGTDKPPLAHSTKKTVAESFWLQFSALFFLHVYEIKTSAHVRCRTVKVPNSGVLSFQNCTSSKQKCPITTTISEEKT